MSGAGYGRIGSYELRGVLGRGGMATVYRAYSTTLRRDVALKVLTAPESKIDMLRERFRREARTIGQLRHPNILTLLDSGEENTIPFLVMELIEGGALNNRLGQPLPPREAVAIARQIGAALDYAHSHGIIHRDVKPANIFLQSDRAVLADFGIVKVFGELGPKLTQTGIGIGTPEYTAPEQALGESIDGRADLYSLGIVLYEMLTGKPPYQGGTLDVINAHVQGRLPDPRGRNPALPPAVGAVLIRALARQPRDRYASGHELAEALAAASGLGPPLPRQPDDHGAARTVMLDRTREVLQHTQMAPAPHLPAADATIIAGQSTPFAGQPTPTARPSLPEIPRALPAVPSRPQGSPQESPAGEETRRDPRIARNAPTLQPQGHLPLTPRPPIDPVPRGGAAAAPFPDTGAATTRQPQGYPPAAFAPLSQPPLQSNAAPQLPPAQNIAPYMAAPMPYQATPPNLPPAATPSAPPRGNLPVVIGLAAALVALLALIGVGGFALVRSRATTTPTVTVASQTQPSAAASVAASPGTPVAGTPLPARAATATAAAAADPARAQIATADTALQEGRFTEAVSTFKAALATNPDSAIANRELGLTLWVWSHDSGEITYLDKATKLNPDDAVAWSYLAFSSVDTHQVERAYASAQRALAADNQQAIAYAAMATCYIRYPPVPSDPESGKQEARDMITRAKALDPDNIWVLWAEHIVLFNDEQYEAALVPLDRMIAQRPNWPTLYAAKGVLYDEWQRPNEARTALDQSLALDPDYPYALTEYGWVEYAAANYAVAKGYFEHALQLTDDTNDSAHIGMAYTLAGLGDYISGIPHCQRAAGIETRLPGGFSCLGYLYRVGTKQYDESLMAYNKVLELRPYLETGHIGVALVQAAQGKYADAEATLKRGLVQIKEPREVYFWLGWVLYQEQKYSEAQPNFEKAVELVPDRADYHFQLGENLEQLQRYPEARAAYERALAIDPSYQSAQDALTRLTQQGH